MTAGRGAEAGVPAVRELAETLEAGRRTAPEAHEVARELFAHGLLFQKAELERPGATFRREARVRAILDRLDAGSRGGPGRAVLRRGTRLVAAAAGVVIAFALWVLWPSPATPAFADNLVERAARAASRGVHVYRVELDRTYRGHRRKGGRERRRTYHYSSTWVAALGPNRRWNVRKITGSHPFVPGTELGSDGRTIWIKAPNGYAFDLFLDPKRIGWTGFEPVMSYFELRPFLDTVFRELHFEVASRTGGKVRLRGSFTYDRGPSRTHDAKRWIRGMFLGEAGRIALTIDEASGLLLELRLEQLRPETSRIVVTRLPAPADLAAAGFEFDPPRVRVRPNVKLWAWMGILGRAWARAVRSRRR